MQDFAKDAGRVSLPFEYGVLSGKGIIEWADTAVTKTDSPPISLLELSTIAPDRTADIISYLHQLASGSDFWTSLRAALTQILDFVTTHPDRAESIANHLFHTACSNLKDVPKDLNFMFRFDDAFSLVRDGIFGEPEAVYRDFLTELSKHTATGT